MKQALCKTIALGAALLVMQAWRPAVSTAQNGARGTHMVSAADRNFVTTIAEGGTTEIALGHVAVARGADRSVRQFGDKMIADHGHAGAELSAIAAREHIPVPVGIAARHQAFKRHLSSLSGKVFDSVYIKQMISDHQGAVKLFRMEIKTGTNPQVRAFAVKYLPTIQMHLKMAQNIFAMRG